MSLLQLTTHLDEDVLLNCMRCGYCLSACPTYRLEPKETSTPRGRIALMRAVHEGKLDIMDIQNQLDFCLGCRACEVVCPAGVQYGQLLEEGRADLTKKRPNMWIVRQAYKYILGTPGGIKFAGFGLWLYQALGLRWLARNLGIIKAIGGVGLSAMEQSMPDTASPSRRSARKQVTPAVGPRRHRVAFFTGCISDIVFWETNQSAIEVLAQAGCEVTIPEGQGCCGAVHGHSGEHEMAVGSAKRNIVAFENGGYDFVVNCAGGCGAALKEYGKLLKDDPEWADRAAKFSASFRDFTQLLATLPPLEMGEINETFTYQDSCHLRNVQKITQQPRNLLKSIPGSKYVELPESDQCCGSAGTYAVGQADASDKILSKKMQHVIGTGASTVVVINPPCHMEMIEGVQRAGLEDKIKVRHIADILKEAVNKKKR